MSWSDTSEIQDRLDTALNAYQWTAVNAAGEGLMRRLFEEREPYPEGAARQVLASLRRKRQFPLAAKVAEAFVRTGQTTPRVRRQYAQALIDQGLLLGAEAVLQSLLEDLPAGDGEVAEAHGLLGRIYKQLYVNAAAPAAPAARRFLERALAEYVEIYQRDPQQYAWQGVNAVALLRRAEADGIVLAAAPAAGDLADAVLASLPERSKGADAFQLATRVEALLALRRPHEAIAAAIDYISHPEADAFEIASTLRQMEEVWRLNDTPPESTILVLLRAALLRAQGGLSQTFSGALDRNIAVVEQAKRDVEVVEQLNIRYEKVLGDDPAVSLGWLQLGLERARSIARIERVTGDGHGTGWVVRSSDFFPGRFPDGHRLLVTNAHVVNQHGSDGALVPEDARANFQALGEKCAFKPTVVWSSPPGALDATFLDFGGTVPTAEPLPVFTRTVRVTVPAPRMFIIGHPQGGELRFSIHDNRLLDHSADRLRYRTRTEEGSSGSPVFEADAWQVVGLHHAGGKFNCLEVKQPPYEANEGIAILAIRNAIAAG